MAEIEAEASGPQFDGTGRFKPYSILGSLDDFHSRSGRLSAQPRPPTGPPPERGWSRRSRRMPTAEWTEQQEETRQLRALQRWEQQGELWQRQQGLIAARTGVEPDMQAMQKGQENYRIAQEIRTLIERAVPALERGQGHRVGSEFWRPFETKNGIPMTLTESEKGNLPPLEIIRRPAILRTEVAAGPPRTAWAPGYLTTRQKELASSLQTLVPVAPDYDGLVVVGKASPSRIVEEEKPTEDSEEEIILTVPGPVFSPAPRVAAAAGGPACTLMANGNQSPSASGCRLLLSLPVRHKTTASFTIANAGDVALYYRWELVPRDSTIVSTRPDGNQFFFDRLPGVIRPGEQLQRQVAFVSSSPGLATETWRLVLQPPPAACAAPLVVLAAAATVADETAKTRAQMERSLESRAMHMAMRQLVESIVINIQARPPPPRREDCDPGSAFLAANKGVVRFFNSRAVVRLRQLYEEAWLQARFPEAAAAAAAPVPANGKPGTRAGRDRDRPPTADAANDRPRPPPWDLRVESIRESIYIVSDPTTQAQLAGQLDEKVVELNSPPAVPHISRHDIMFGVVSTVVDRMVGQASRLRTLLQLPEPPFVIQQPDDDQHAESKGGSSKTLAPRKDSAKRPGTERRSGKAPSVAVKARDMSKSTSTPTFDGQEDESPDRIARRRLHDSLLVMTRELVATAIGTVEEMLAGQPRYNVPSADHALLLDILGDQ